MLQYIEIRLCAMPRSSSRIAFCDWSSTTPRRWRHRPVPWAGRCSRWGDRAEGLGDQVHLLQALQALGNGLYRYQVLQLVHGVGHEPCRLAATGPREWHPIALVLVQHHAEHINLLHR